MPVSDYLDYIHAKVSTPALVVDEKQLNENLRSMQAYANEYNVKLRPHCKTHKSATFAKKQLTLGAAGITVAKPAEAEIMAKSGINDIFIANQISQKLKIKRLRALNDKINLIIGIDHPDQITILESEFKSSVKPLKVRIEIDCGFNRCGIEPDDKRLVNLAHRISDLNWLVLDGLFTHAGHAYSASSREMIKTIARQEAFEILKAQDNLKKSGIEVAELSVGSTPTAREVIKIPGVTEARPGNYIFYDGIQQSLDVSQFEQCSLFVIATIISQPAPNRIVCDAGSKALSMDKGAHSAQTLDHYGTVLNVNGKITRISEEHGIIELKKDQNIRIGSPVLIIPNHACVVVNLYDQYYCFDEKKSVQTIPILARGKSQ